MTIERLDHPELAPVPGAAAEPSHGEQATRAVRNLAVAAAAAGASLADVARLTIYVVGYTPEVFEEIVGAVVTELGEYYPITAATLVGVVALWRPGLVIEIDATIVAD